MGKLKGDVLKVANILNKRISSSEAILKTKSWNEQREFVTDTVIEVTGLNEIDDNDGICLLVNALCEKYNIGISKDDSDINDFSEEDTEDYTCSLEMYEYVFNEVKKYAEEDDIDLTDIDEEQLSEYCSTACDNNDFNSTDIVEDTEFSVFQKMKIDLGLADEEDFEEDDFPEMKSYELKEWIENHDEITPEVLNDALNNFENLSQFDYDPSEYERRMYELAEYYEIDEDTIADYLE